MRRVYTIHFMMLGIGLQQLDLRILTAINDMQDFQSIAPECRNDVFHGHVKLGRGMGGLVMRNIPQNRYPDS